LHPAIVHLPLGLAFVMPLLALAAAWAVWTGRARAGGWLAVVLLQALLLGAGVLAMQTGERDEERVQSVVPDVAMERHEAYAQQFIVTTAATLLVGGLVSLVRHRRAAAGVLMATTVVGTIVVAGAAIRVGHAGGQLVYTHNAGAVYSAGTIPVQNGRRSPAAERGVRQRADE
jgi:uncharacterized membrane protein